MNISQMMRSLMGDVQSGENRKLELKPGQVVRGIVLQTQGDQEAVVQINGVQVKAKLETPLTAGQTAMLKVQPDSTSEMIVLKPVDTGGGQLSDEAIKQLVKSAGLPDTKWAMSLVRDLRRDGIPITREVAEAIKQAYQAMPKGANPEEWMQAAAASLKRGMPLTEQTIAAMRQIMFGRPLHVLLDKLGQQLDGMLADSESQAVSGEGAGADVDGGGAGIGKIGGGAAEAAARVKSLLAQANVIALAQSASNELSEAANASRAGADETATDQGRNEGQQRESDDVRNSQRPAGRGAAAAAAYAQAATLGDELAGAEGEPEWNRTSGGGSASSVPSPSHSNGNPTAARGQTDMPGWIGKMLQVLGVSHEHELLQETARTLPVSGLSAAPEADSESAAAPAKGSTADDAEDGANPEARSASSAPANELSRSGLVKADSRAANGLVQSQQGLQAASAASGEVDAEGTAAVNASRTAAIVTAGATGTGALPEEGAVPAQPMPHGVRPGDAAAVSETLKSALMALASSDDAPASLRETAQQLIHQITGQQLMLSPERNGSVLTHVTLFIPIIDANGGQTASVHVQTRRGAQDELDASNCRILFDLNLKAIGNTIVDVHVVDHIVNLNVWNDHPVMQRIADDERGAVSEALQKAGYQLLTFKVKPMPDMSDHASIARKADGTLDLPPVIPSYGGTAYKGVDYRI